MNREGQRYLLAVPAERHPLVANLHSLILGLHPRADLDMSFRMLTSRAKDGWVVLTNQKTYVSL